MTQPKPDIMTIDATNKPLGRLASELALKLQGKHLATYRPERPPTVFIEVTNASAIALTGNKRETKVRYHSSRFPGGIKKEFVGQLLATNPAKALRDTVLRMLPDNRQRRGMLKHLIIKA